MEGDKKMAKPGKPHVLRAGRRQAGGHWQPAGSLDRDGWNPKASWASACHTHRAQGEQPSWEQAPCTHHRTHQGWRCIFNTPSHTGLSGEAFSQIQDSQPNTLPCKLGPTDSPAKSRQESCLQARGKGCWGALSYSSPMHTAIACRPSHERLTQCMKGLYRSDAKLEQTHNQERFEISKKLKAGKCVTVPLLFLPRPMLCMKPDVTHLRNLK